MDDCADALEACARGDEAALRRIFETEAGQLLGVAQRILRRRELAEEAVQDAFVQIWRKAGQFDRTRGSGRGWVYAVVRNRSLNILRSADRERPEEPGTIEARLEDGEADIAFGRLDERSSLRRCLGELDDLQRRSVLMAYVLGYTHGEIAGRLGTPLGTTKAWIRRSLIRLRECMS